MPQHKRGPWSQSEDQLLLHLVSLHGASNWVRIAATIQTRSPKQCRERYHQNLKPNLNHDPITPEEGILIEQMVAEMGKRWAEIARRLRGRSDNAVKNWWNGGMNRRRRNRQHRRTAELEAHHHPSNNGQMPTLPHPMQQQQPLPRAFHQPPMMPPQHQQQQQQQQQHHYYPQSMFHPGHAHAHLPQHISVPSNVPGFNRLGMVETPLPSPSAFSQMSADGAPSLISDCSSISARSPLPGTSPIELPPLSGVRDDHRRSSVPMLRLGVPGSYVHENDFQHPAVQMHRFEEMSKQQQPPMLQEPFMPQHPQQQHSLPLPPQYLPSQPRHHSSMQNMSHQYTTAQQQQYQQQHKHVMERPRSSALPVPPKQVPSTPSPAVQLPSISNLASAGRNTNETTPEKPAISIDPGFCTPGRSTTTPDGSPKDKMSLSNLTL